MKIKSWIIDRERTGRPCFSRDEVARAFPSLSASSIDSSLSRFRANGLVQAVHRGFYCVIPAHYAYVGKVPPAYYIDELMKWLGRPYYIALLSAAEMFGAPLVHDAWRQDGAHSERVSGEHGGEAGVT